MLIKAHHPVFFLLYTIIIYFLSVIIGTIISLFCYGIEGINFYWEIGSGVFRRIDEILLNLLFTFRFNELFHWILLLGMATLVSGYFLPFIYWFFKPSLLKAWYMSVQGLFLGFGNLSFINPISRGESFMGIYIFLIICALYSFLYFGGKYQKKYYPDNKLANKIRYALVWPCLKD